MPQRLHTTKEVAGKLGTYERAVNNLADLHRVPYAVASKGSRSEMRLYTPAAVDRLRVLVAEWKARPRMSRKAAAAS